MIWNSTALMTAIDLVIVVITGAAAGIILRQWRELKRAGMLRASVLILFGLGLISGFYLIDLWIMLVLPRLTSPMRAMQTMENLRLNWNWTVVVLAVISIFIGFRGVVRGGLSLLHSLRKSDRRHKGLFQNAPVSIWEEDFSAVKTYLDDLGFFEIEDVESYFDEHPDVVRQCAQRVTVLAVNRRAAELHEAEDEAGLLKELSRITEGSYVAFRQELMAMWRRDTMCEVEGQIATLKGTLRDVVVTWSIMPGHEQDLSRVLVSLLDVTDRKRSEEELRESEQRLRLTLDAVSDGAWDWNVATGEVGYSDRWVESLGYRREEVEPHVSFWRSILHPDDVPKVDEALTAHFDGRTHHYECENRIRMKSGEYRENLDRGRVISRDAHGRPLRMVGTDTDITERKRAEEGLRLREQQLDLIYDSTADILYYLEVEPGPHYRFLTVNSAFLKATSLTAAQIVGKTINEVIPEPSLKLVRSNYETAIRERRIVYWEEDSEFPAGLRTGVVSIAPVFDDQGNCTHLVGSVHDITDRKRAEEALQFTQFAIDRSSDPAFWIDRAGRFSYVNDAACGLLGYARQELLSMSITDITDDYGGASWPERWQEIMRLGSTSFEGRHRTKDGTIVPVDVTANYVEFRGVEYVCAFARDITARRQAESALRSSERRYRTLFQDSRDAVYITAVDGRFVDTNSAGLELLGYSREELPVMRVADVSDDLEGMRQFQDVVDRVGFVKDYQARVRHKDGTVLDCLLTSTVRRATDGTVLGYQTIARDDTQRRRMENELRQSRNELYIRNRISHVFLTEPGDEMFGELRDILLGATESDFGFVGYIDEEGALACPSMKQQVRGNWHRQRGAVVLPPSIWEGIWGQSLRERRTTWSNEPLKMPESELQLNAAIAVPIVYGQKLIGQFVLANKPDGYNAGNGKLLDNLAEYISPLLQSRLRAEHNRKSSERGWAAVQVVHDRLQLSIERMPIGYMLWNAKGKVVTWNPAAEKIFGFTSTEAVGRSLPDLVVPEAVRPEAANVVEALLRGEEQSCLGPSNNVRKDGALISCQWFHTPIHSGDQEEASLVLSMVLDVTERADAETALRLNSAALQAASNAVVITDNEGAIQWINSAFERITGYNTVEILGRNPRFLKSGKQDRAFYTQLWDTILAGRTWRGELINKRKNGTLYTEEQSITPVCSDSGDITHFISIRIDVTERKRLEREVLEIDERERERIGQDLHDVLGQQLTGMGLMLQALREKIERQEAVDSDVVIELQDLVKTATAHTRFISRGLLPFPPGRGELTDALEDLASTAEKLFDIACDTELPGDLVTDRTVARHLYHIAQEAVTNAVRHGAADRVVIGIQPVGDGLILSVSDDGCGIPDSLALDTGLGLTTMGYRAHAMGGSLELRRGEECGTVVRCTLPRVHSQGRQGSTYVDG